MSLTTDLIARQSAEVAYTAVSNRAIAVAVGHLYQAALALKAARGVTVNDVTQYLTPAQEEVVRQLQGAAQRARIAAIEKPPEASIIETDIGTADRTADFLREVNHRGGGVQLR